MTKINRRHFVKKSAAIGATSLIGSSLLGRSLISITKLPAGKVDIAVVKGEEYMEIAMEAVRQLGGMEKFVPKGSKVAILANPQRNNPGAYTKPEVVGAAVVLCKKAGASEIACISWLPEENWVETGIKKVLDDEGVTLVVADRRNEELFKPVAVPGGIALKEARIMKSFFDYDVLIDIPVTKDHAGNKFTGTMKNLMGLNSPKSNRTFHRENWATDPEAISHMDQCIADLNTVIKPDLCIVDATEFIITNGPFGPGELFKPQKVVAGTDRVAIDAYCSTLWGLDPQEIKMIKMGHAHKLGEIDLKKLTIKEVEV